MSIVLNEVRQAEDIIEKGEVGNKPTSTLFLLGKYYRQHEKLSKTETAKRLDEFMSCNYKDYNSASWESIIEDVVRKATKYPMRELDYVGITQYELDSIASLGNLKFQKLVFTMLCCAKMYNTISPTNNGWINTEVKDIYRLANVTVKHRRDKFFILHDLEQTGLIAFSKKNDNMNMQVTFIDMDGDPVLNVSDFRELGYEYMRFMGDDKFIRCERCSRLVKRTNNKRKYCTDCAKVVKSEQDKEYYRRILRK